MTAERREDDAARLLLEALDRPATERTAFLDEACAGDADLRAEIESLLEAHERAGDFLERMDLERAAALVESLPEPAPEGIIGAYRLIRELGRGGMGVVYLAERADGQFEQRVALKLLKRGMDSDEILRRFLLERQILARLQHPNIAALLDGGVSEQGQPYFAMEHVDGLQLLDYCDRHRLGVAARLRLFDEIGRAVRHAHQNLIVHRDLKPSNILVTAAGQVKLLDFGIAKLIDTSDGSGAATLTATGLRLVTPEYGSPEQLRGEPVTTSTDIYALGVILYELLTGRRPHTFSERTPEALARLAGAAEPSRPSTAVLHAADRGSAEAAAAARSTTVPGLGRRLRGDLDTIVLQALRREPDRRYPSVEAFLEDLGRHRSGLPVRARPDTFVYRSSKFIRRHRISVAAFTLVMLSLAGGLVVALWQRSLARTEAAKAEQVQKFLIETFEVSDPWKTKGDEVTARELLDRGAARIRKSLATQPEIQARMMSVIGNLYLKLGIYDEAIAQLEQALEIRTKTLGPHSLAAADSQEELAIALIESADYDRGEPLIRKAIETRRGILGHDDAETGTMLNTLGLLLAEKGEYDEAVDRLREALAIHRRTLGENDEATLSTMGNLGLALRWGGKLDEAEQIHRKALELNRRAFGDDDARTAWALERLGVGLAQKGDTAAAQPLLREGLGTLTHVLGKDHSDVALAQNNLAKTLMLGGDPAAAEPLFRSALDINTAVHGDDSLYITTNLANLAEVLILQEKYSEAVPLLERATSLRRSLLGEDHPEVARVQQRLAYAVMLTGDLDRAGDLYSEALPKARAGWDPEHPDLATLLAGYGKLRLLQGRSAEAEPLLREALTIRKKVLVKDDWQIGEGEALLGECLLDLGRPGEAQPLLREGHDLLQAKRGADDPAARHAGEVLSRIEAAAR